MIKAYDGTTFRVGEDLDRLEAHLRKGQAAVKKRARQNRGKDIPAGKASSVSVLALGLRAVKKEARTGGIWSREDLYPRYRPYWDLLVKLGYKPEVRNTSYDIAVHGFHLYVQFAAGELTP